MQNFFCEKKFVLKYKYSLSWLLGHAILVYNTCTLSTIPANYNVCKKNICR